MKKKTISIALAALFLLLSAFPAVGLLFLGESKAAANETLASPPRLMRADGRINPSVLDETTDYIADHFAFRTQLVNAWAELNTTLFRTSPEEQVVLGSDGWLYYASTLDDYMGRGMSETELISAVHNLALMQEYAESCGAEFIFTIAPNKNSLYPRQMPSYIPCAHDHANSERIKPLLDSVGIHYQDLFSLFDERGEVLYYRTDSHWTDRGAALAADALLNAFGMPSSYFEGPFLEDSFHSGDLYEMLFPTGKRAEKAQSYEKGFSYTTAANPKGGNAMRIDTMNGSADGTLVCWRDSFGISLYPYLAESFGEAHFLREANYNLTEIGSIQADHVLIELVERNLAWLIRYAPVMPAPHRTINLSSAVSAEFYAAVHTKTDSKTGLIYISGEVPCPYNGESVYLISGNSAYEACLTERDEKWSFHAYLDQDSNVNAVCIGSPAALTIYPIQLN